MTSAAAVADALPGVGEKAAGSCFGAGRDHDQIRVRTQGEKRLAVKRVELKHACDERQRASFSPAALLAIQSR